MGRAGNLAHSFKLGLSVCYYLQLVLSEGPLTGYEPKYTLHSSLTLFKRKRVGGLRIVYIVLAIVDV